MCAPLFHGRLCRLETIRFVRKVSLPPIRWTKVLKKRELKFVVVVAVELWETCSEVFHISIACSI